LTESDRDRTGFALRPVFLSNQPPMLAGRDPDSKRFPIVNTHTIGSKFGPLLLGILQDHQATCADITAAVVLMPTRRGEFEHIDLITAFDVFRDRALRYSDGLKRFVRPQPLFPSPDHVQTCERGIQAK